jgi:hypothetical protein
MQVPSILISRQSRYQPPLVPAAASGTAAASNSARSGSGPSRARALNSAAFVGTLHDCDHPDAHDRPSTRSRITSS